METLRTWFLLKRLRGGVHRPAEKLRSVQDQLLRTAVSHAYSNVPFYRRYWDDFGFDVSKFRGLIDLERIPILTGDQVKCTSESQQPLASGINRQRCTFLDSSGSSGHPLRIWKRPGDERVRRAGGLRIWFEHGFRWHHRTAQFQILPGPAHYLQRFGVSRKVWISTSLPIEEQLTRFLSTKADFVVGTPTALRRLSRALLTSGLTPKQPITIFGAGELLDDETINVVEKALNVKPVGLYGQTEVGYVAWQCEYRSGFHINADTHIVEILRNGSPAAPAELGRVVITDLYSRTMPFIRYDTGDIAMPSSGPCPCGRSLPTIDSLEGRAKGMLHLRNGKTITTREFINHASKVLCLGEYRIHQQRADQFRVELVPNARISGAGSKNIERARIVVDHLQHLLGDVQISLRSVEPWGPDGTGKTHTVFT